MSGALATAEPWDLVATNYAAQSLPYFEAFSREALRLAALPPSARVAIFGLPCNMPSLVLNRSCWP